MTKKYSPGSIEAIDSGCTCPRMDNNNGKGYMGMSGIFVYNEDCKYHSEFIKKPIESINNDQE